MADGDVEASGRAVVESQARASERLSEAFDLFSGGNDTLPRAKVGDVLRATGVDALLHQKRLYAAIEHVAGGVDELSLPQARLEAEGNCADATDARREIDSACAALATGSSTRGSTIDAGELKRLLTSVGEALSASEADALIEMAEKDEGGDIKLPITSLYPPET